MKYLVTLFIGMLVGAAIAIGLLYVNPLTQRSGPAMTSADEAYRYSSPITGALAFTDGGRTRLPSRPSDIAALWEATIDKTALSIIVLEGPDGSPVGIASRISYPDEDTDFLRRGALLDDEWLVSMPGRGSLFVTSQSNWWLLLRDTVIPVWYLGRPWSGPTIIEPTVGPGDAGLGILSGASGEFANRSGVAAERYVIRKFDDRVGLHSVAAELFLSWNEQASGP